MTLRTAPDPKLVIKADDLQAERHATEWLIANDHSRQHARQVKIREGVYVIQNMLKTPGGLIRVRAVNEDGRLHDVYISGDFFFYPAENLTGLERALDGVHADIGSVTEAATQFYARLSVESPGVQPNDFARVLFPTPA